MIEQGVIYDGSTAALGLMWFGMCMFVAVYASVRWWTHFVGRALMAFAVNFAVVTGIGLAYRIYPDTPFQNEIKFVAWWFMAGGTFWLLASLVRQRARDILNSEGLEHK